jgi:hypothetical protein
LAEWYEKSEDYTEKDKQFLLLAYRNTLCKPGEGQQVLCHLMTILSDIKGKSDTEIVIQKMLLDSILNNCGITGNMKIINALSKISGSFQVPKEEDKNLLNVE